MAKPTKFLDNIEQTSERYQRMDREVLKRCPRTGELLAQSGHGGIHYALRWEIVMFADEYDIQGVFLWWDQFILNKDRFDEFSFDACLAHVMQIPPTEDESVPMIEIMQNFSKWDVKKAINDTYAIIDPPRLPQIAGYSTIAYCGLAVLSFFILYKIFFY